MPKIIITGALHDRALELLRQQSWVDFDYMPDLERGRLLEIIANYDCIISRSETDVDRELIEKGTALKVIARAAVGVGNIDIDYATSKGILVFNTPGLNTNSAAELTLGLMLSACRKIPQAHKSMEQGLWNRHQFTGSELRGKTVGIIGLGNVGSRLAKFLHAMDCELLAYDPYVTASYCTDCFCSQVDLPELLSKADIVSVHTPKNSQTEGMIGAAELAMMKDKVVIVNAARGGIINESVLADNLASGKVAAAGIDTWEVEPVMDSRLKSFPNVVMTPHIGASTEQAQLLIAETVVKEALAGIRGGIVSNPLNLPNVKVLTDNTIIKYSVLAERLGRLSAQYLDKEFHPRKIEFLYRGSLKKEDSGLVMLSFIKGFLSCNTNVPVSYVNALELARAKGFTISESDDKNFSDFDSAIRVRIHSSGRMFSVGGTLLGKDRIRMTYFQGLLYEIEPAGDMMFIENNDKPGVVGHIGLTMERHGMNINQFHLSRFEPGGTATTIILLDSKPAKEVIADLAAHKNIISAKYVDLN